MPDLSLIAGLLAADATLLILVAPWALLCAGWSADRPLIDRILLGLTWGLAATITCGYILALVGHLDLFWIAPLTALAGGGFLCWKNRGAPSTETPFSPWLLLLIGILLVAYAAPTLSTPFPIGWDPAFHSILAQKILDAGALAADWRPFEEIDVVNYTQGSHVLIALIARWSGQPVHLIFHALHLPIQLLAALLVWRLGLLFFAGERTALMAGLTYGLLCHYGSFSSYYEWGGVPTAIGALFFMGVVWLSLAERGWRQLLPGAVLFGSLVLTHHLSALIATWVLLFYIGVSLLGRTAGELRGNFFRLLGLAFVAYSFYILPYAARIVDLGGTDALTYAYDAFKSGLQVVEDLGYIASLLGAIGLVLASHRLQGARQEFLLCWITALLLGFCLLGYIYRIAAYQLYGIDVTAFTPSRFLTVVSYPLALYAGHALHLGLEKLEKYLRDRAARFADSRYLLAGAICIVTLISIPRISRLAAMRNVPEEAPVIGAFVRRNVPEDGFVLYSSSVLDLLRPLEWIPYLTWRATIYTPIPASEPRDRFRAKLAALQSGSLEDAGAWIDAQGLTGYMVHESEPGKILVNQIRRDAQPPERSAEP